MNRRVGKVETAAIFTLQGLLILYALYRGKSDRIVLTLLAGWIAASAIGPTIDDMHRQVPLSVIDALIGVTMALLWTAKVDMRAWWIGVIGFAKVGARITYVSGPYIDHWWFAAAINCALLLQIMVAGGLLDAIGHRLDDMLRRVAPRRHGLLRDGAR